MCYDSFICDTTHPYATWLICMWHDSFIWEARQVAAVIEHDSFVFVPCFIHMWHDSFIRDMTHLYVWHDSFTCVTWLIHIWYNIDVVYIQMCDTTFSYETWLIYMCDMTHSHVWHDPFITLMSYIFICATRLSHTWHDSFIWEWRLSHPHVQEQVAADM